MEARQLERSEVDTVIEIDAEGVLHGDEAVLAKLRGQRLHLTISGDLMTLRPETRVLSQITDAEERKAAYQAFKAQIMRRGGGPIPSTRAELNELVYD